MDFFHCSFCFRQPGPPENRKFILASCGHIFCDTCENFKNESQCKVCNASCRLMLLNNEIPDDIKVYFSDLTTEFKKTIRNLVIKLKQCKIYMEEYVPSLEMKYLTAKATIEKQNVRIDVLSKEMGKLMEKVDELKRENRKLMERSSRQIQQTPPFKNCGKGSSFNFGPSPVGDQLFGPRMKTLSNSSLNGEKIFMSPVESPSLKRSTPVLTALEAIQKKQGRGWKVAPETPRQQNQMFLTSSNKSNAFSNMRSRTPSTLSSWSNSSVSRKSSFTPNPKLYNM